MEFCKDHIDLIRENATLSANVKDLCEELKEVKDRIIYHINEAEKSGGRHEQMIKTTEIVKSLQNQISVIKKGYWFSGAVGGVVGGLIGAGSPEAVNIIAKFFIK